MFFLLISLQSQVSLMTRILTPHLHSTSSVTSFGYPSRFILANPPPLTPSPLHALARTSPCSGVHPLARLLFNRTRIPSSCSIMYHFEFPPTRSLLFLFLCEIYIVSPWVLRLHSLSIPVQFTELLPFPPPGGAKFVNCDRSVCY